MVKLAPGSHTLLLTVTDELGAKARAGVNVNVIPPLEATISTTPDGGSAAPLTVQFACQLRGGSADASDAPRDVTDDGNGIVTAQGEW